MRISITIPTIPTTTTPPIITRTTTTSTITTTTHNQQFTCKHFRLPLYTYISIAEIILTINPAIKIEPFPGNLSNLS